MPVPSPQGGARPRLKRTSGIQSSAHPASAATSKPETSQQAIVAPDQFQGRAVWA